MTDVPQVQPGQLVKIGTIAALNITKALNLPAEAVHTVETAIDDEIKALSSHFTMAVADVQTQHEIAENTLKAKFAADVAAVKADYSFLKEHEIAVVAALLGAVGLGVFVGLILAKFV